VRLLVNAAGVSFTVELDEGDATGLYSLLLDGKLYNAAVWQRRGRREVQIGQWSSSLEVVPAQAQRPSARPAASVGGRQEISAPMSGRVVQVLVQAGQRVDEGESLVIIEAMKMETEIRAMAPGQVSAIQVAVDMAVEAGQLLLVIEP
jgi:oxaloacetate decarboxylase alpha subunit